MVQIAVPQAGFGLKLDAINAWHLYAKIKQRRDHPARAQAFSRWFFENLESAERFKQRFGGELVPAAAAIENRKLVGGLPTGKVARSAEDEPTGDGARTGN
jgi:hypothetical protein